MVELRRGKPAKSCKTGRSGYALDSEKKGATGESRTRYGTMNGADSPGNADWSCNELPRGPLGRAIYSAASALKARKASPPLERCP
jgi:hypothetical protein